MNVHFIAIGGSVMHNLAICLRNKGYNVTGSDDEIFEPAASKLRENNLLPKQVGWFPEKISKSTDAVILGMHAKPDNPELLKAKQLDVKIFSFPEYIYNQSKNKKRVVIGGSHGKTSITSMIMHVLKYLNFDFDYLVGSRLEGFDLMVKITDAPIIILEGDEYLASPIDKTPKFLFYKPHVALVSGIAWDHINVFPTFENYVEQFTQFIKTIEPQGSFIYYKEDAHIQNILKNINTGSKKIPYGTPSFKIENNQTFLTNSYGTVPLQIFGKHNLQNLEGARLVCNQLDIADEQFYHAIQTFKGAAKRMELMATNDTCALYKDFAHSPSKLTATINALKEQYPHRKLVACMELHTFSSLNKNFLKEYQGSMDAADFPIIFFNAHTLELKGIPDIQPHEIKKALRHPELKIFTEVNILLEFLKNIKWENTNLLMMSSGNFDNLDWNILQGYLK